MHSLTEYKTITINNKDDIWEDSIKALESDDYKIAAFLLEEYMEMDKERTEAYNNLAFAYIKLKEYRKAKTILKRAFNKFRSSDLDSFFYYNYAIALIGIGDSLTVVKKLAKESYEEGLYYLEEYIQKEPNDADAKQLKNKVIGILEDLKWIN